jgi:hypothetical protein
MPRDGSGIYTKPFPDVVTGTTIQSTVHNGTISDVAQDLNAPRPIVAGGTGANNARDAMTSLQGDVAYQVVTNYDAYAFVSGSFYSAAGATSAPTANAFIGQCYTSDPAVVPPAVPAGQNMFIEARDVTTGMMYLRQKTAGVWGAWAQQAGGTAALDAAYVNVSGDTMTGALTVALTGSPTTGTYYFGNTGTKSLSYDGANYTLTGGQLTALQFVSTGNTLVQGALYVGYNQPTANMYFGPTSHSLSFDGANFLLAGAPFITTGFSIISRSNTTFAPATPDNASFVANGNYGGGITFQDGGGRGTIWGETNSLNFGIGNPSVKKIMLSSDGALHFKNAGLSGAYYDTIAGADRFFAGADGVGDTWRIYSVAAGNIITVAYGGPVTITTAVTMSTTLNVTGVITSGSDGGHKVQVPAGNYARHNSTVTGVRTWQWGCDPSGNFVMTDETAGAFRLSVGLGGDWNFQAHALTGISTITTSAQISCGYGYQCRQGVAGAFGGQYANQFYSGGNMLIYADNTLVSGVVSDYRVKKDVIDLPSMWDTVKGLRPISYTHQDFSPQSHLDLQAQNKAAGKESTTDPFIEGDDIERWGFIAHELQETLVDSAATAPKDAPDAIQGVNLAPVVAALTKALQEAMARIEALEVA